MNIHEILNDYADSIAELASIDRPEIVGNIVETEHGDGLRIRLSVTEDEVIAVTIHGVSIGTCYTNPASGYYLATETMWILGAVRHGRDGVSAAQSVRGPFIVKLFDLARRAQSFAIARAAADLCRPVDDDPAALMAWAKVVLGEKFDAVATVIACERLDQP